MYILVSIALHIVAIIEMVEGDMNRAMQLIILGAIFLCIAHIIDLKRTIETQKKEAAKALSDAIVAAKLLDLVSGNGKENKKTTGDIWEDSVEVKD